MMEPVAPFAEFGESGGSIRDAVGLLPPSDRDSVLAYLAAGVPFSAVPGSDNDVIDGEPTLLSPSDLTDGRFVWRRDLAHYVRKYDVGLNEDFLAHVRTGAAPPTELDAETWERVFDWIRSRQG